MNEELLDRFAPFYDLEYAGYDADLDRGPLMPSGRFGCRNLAHGWCVLSLRCLGLGRPFGVGATRAAQIRGHAPGMCVQNLDSQTRDIEISDVTV